MDTTARKWTGRAIQLVLGLAVLAYVGNWVRGHLMSTRDRLHVSGVSTLPDTLGPGDLRIYNADSTLDVVLIGDKIAAGLSPKMIAKVRSDIDSSKSKHDSGLAGDFARFVTGTVASKIGMHAMFPLKDLKDVHYDGGKLVFDWRTGSDHTLFQTTNINGKKADDTFTEAEAQKLIAAVHARQKELGYTP
ncbi:MAG: hypothetical protein KGN74_00740 [Gemmatimonadota bacterium]|nr:hypothetical protein [Gemmatimonadota bacterium]MDE3171572.1 hypothetical protein [Gemmatimonadota bacterium]MDE3217309.1 hypothetical protein [Gemmatimonadota bacterium]